MTTLFALIICSRSKFLSKILKILVKNFREIFPEFFFYSFANFNEKNSNLDGNRFGHTADGRPGWKDGADTVHPFSAPAIISMIQLLPGLNNYAGNVITLDVSEKNILHVDTMQSWYDDANISIDADGTTLFSKKHQTGGSNRVDTTEIGDIDVSQYELITINFSVVSKNGQGWGKLNNIIIS